MDIPVLSIDSTNGQRLKQYLLGERVAATASGVASLRNSAQVSLIGTGPIDPSDRAAVVAATTKIKMQMDTSQLYLPAWTFLLTNASYDPCFQRVYGIWCEGNPGRITMIDIKYPLWNVDPSLPAEFGQLTKLRHLVIYQTLTLLGPLPDSLCDLTELETLILTSQQYAVNGGLTSMPSCTWPHIIDLELYGNSIPAVPSSLAAWTNLRYLYLQKNAISSMPSLSALFRLERLDISQNAITGPCPVVHPDAPLALFAVGNNRMTGSINPAAFDNYSQLQVIDVNNNRIQGPLPTLLGATQLTYIDFSSQRPVISNPSGFTGFVGRLPVSWGAFSGLNTMLLQENTLTGFIPNQNWTSLYIFSLSCNEFTGATVDHPDNRDASIFLSSLVPSGSIITDVEGL